MTSRPPAIVLIAAGVALVSPEAGLVALGQLTPLEYLTTHSTQEAV